MSRIVLNHIELTAINGKIWVYDRKAGDGRFSLRMKLLNR